MRLRLDGLNPPQYRAVMHERGPMLVLAGAGSGKTRVVTMRIARLLYEGTSARAILAVTFTNKAAKEMKERVLDLVPADRARGITISTFHSLCARMLRRDGEAIDLSPNFQILDVSDQIAQLNRVAKEDRIHLDEVQPRAVLGRIGLFKNKGWRPEEVPGQGDIEGRIAQRLYPLYSAHLRGLSAVDFDDLLLLARELLETDEKVRARYKLAWEHVLIDEYQDTNPLQLDLIRLIVGPHHNITAVGDDDQSIYGFRGADVENILSFDQHFAGAVIVKLEQNYRSTSAILDAANAVIEKEPHRRPKTLFSELGKGELPRLVPCADGDQEGVFVAREIGLILSEGKHQPEDIALLYRAGPQSRLFEEHLRLNGVPYRVVGGQEFFERREVKDVLAYLTLIARPDMELPFRRVVNLPSRGLGDATVKKVIARSRELLEPLVFFGAKGAPGCGLKDKQRAELERFCLPLVRAHNTLRDGDPEADPSALCERAIRDAGLQAAIQREKDLAQREKIEESLEEVMTSVSAFAERLRDARESPDLPESQLFNEIAEGQDALGGFLDRVALDEKEREKDKQDDDKKDKTGKVTLMSLHASKGLEYPVVFFVGFEEGLLPHRRVLEEGDGVSEERRLCYVGITRAQRLLYFTWATARRRRNRMVPRAPSRFLQDLPEGGALTVEGPREVTEDEQDAMADDFFAKMRAILPSEEGESESESGSG